MQRSTSSLVKRLSSYWKMEAANVILVPVAMIFLAQGKVGWASIATFVPMMLLLIIGTAYWRAKLKQLTEPDFAFEQTMRRIKKAHPFTLVSTLASIMIAFLIWIMPSFSAGLADRICASIAALLAALEYINYYHRQIQHFDNLADWKRFISGRGFRKSQMARDLEKISS